MGGGASRRYMMGKNPARFFQENVIPEMSETLETLDISKESCKILFDQFIEIDSDNSGEVSVGELHAYLQIKQTKFTERVFFIIDTDGSGSLDFKELVIGVWNYCTYDIKLIAKLAFEIFDVDKLGKLELCECDAMIRMLWAPKSNIANPVLVSRVEEFCESGLITYEQFLKAVERYESILQPAFDLQRVLRQRFLGVKYWQAACKKRKLLFASVDGVLDSWASIQNILTIKQRQREEERAARELELSVEKNERVKDFTREAIAHQLDRKAALKRKAEVLKAKRLPEDDAEARALQRLQLARDRMSLDYELDDLEDRKKCRAHLWQAFDKVMERAELAIKVHEEKDLKIAVEADAVAKAEEYLATEEGQIKFEFDTKARYGLILYDKFAHHSVAPKGMAAMFQPEIEGHITAATQMAFKVAPKRDMEIAQKLARQAVVERFKQQESDRVKQDYKEKREEKSDALLTLETELVANFGTRHTEWEKLWDVDRGEYFWYHCNQKRMYWQEPAVCEKCDMFIDPMDPKCFNCNTPRSAKNMQLYKGDEVMGQWSKTDVVFK